MLRAAPCGGRSTSWRRRGSSRAAWGSGTFVGAPFLSGTRRAGEVADQVSPLQLIEARLAVEPFTTRLAVLHATRRNLDDMEVVLKHAEELITDKELLSPKWDGEFHLLIAHASGNPLLINVYRQINHVRLHAQWDAMKGEDPDARGGRRL